MTYTQLNKDWTTDFPTQYETLINQVDIDMQNHYIFFFKDNTFECVAESYKIEFS